MTSMTSMTSMDGELVASQLALVSDVGEVPGISRVAI